MTKIGSLFGWGLDPYLLMLSVKQGTSSTIAKVFGVYQLHLCRVGGISQQVSWI